MKLLLDTHLLLWAANTPKKLSKTASKLISDEENVLVFSAASLWEIMIKSSLQRADFQVNASLLRQGLIENGYIELPILSKHVLTLNALPTIHKDPFDRILIAQAITEDLSLLSVDPLVTQYTGPIIAV